MRVGLNIYPLLARQVIVDEQQRAYIEREDKELLMSKKSSKNTVPIQKAEKRRVGSTEKIWGKPVLKHGYAGIPSILIRSQARLGLSPTQMNIIVQLLDYWFDPNRPPFPSKKDLAGRIGVTAKTIQNNIRELEKAGYIERQMRRTRSGDWNSNIYHLDGLVKKIRKLEPEFTEARDKRAAIKKLVETPKGRRKRA